MLKQDQVQIIEDKSFSNKRFIAEEVSSEQKWLKVVDNWPDSSFRQSWQWGEFERKMGKSAWFLVMRDQFEADRVVACCLVVKESAKRGSYLSIAGGPMLDWSEAEPIKAIFEFLKIHAKKHGCKFIRFRPQELETNIAVQFLQSIGAIKAPMHLTADLTLQLDLKLSEAELLSAMRKNTRYSIRKAQSLGIWTEISTDENQIEDFYNTQLELASRQGFVPFQKDFLLNQFLSFKQKNMVALVHSYSSDNQLLASAFVIFTKNEAVYHYGVSTLANSHLPGSYAVQWRAVSEAKNRGCLKYNFWGIAPKDALNHRFSGVSLFKRGFGGQEVQYLPAHDVIVDNSYWFIYIFEWFRKKLRKL